MIDDTADALLTRWPKAQAQAQPAPTRRDWLAFAFWLMRLVVEGLGWLAILGLITRI